MNIVFLSNHFHHHQKPLSDYLYEVNSEGYRFVEMYQELDDGRKKLGFSEYQRPYIIKYMGNKKEVENLINNADVVICGEAPVSLIKSRVAKGKLTFKYSERRYKNLFKYLKYPIYSIESLTYNKCYLLSASAFGARDFVLSGMKANRCFRWGYFTAVKDIESIDTFIDNKREYAKQHYGGKVTLLWVGRMISWKHPELVVKVAKKLKNDNLNFYINMIGMGYMEESLQKLVERNGLSDCVTILGQRGQDEVRKYMELFEVYMFTSDEGEGWGAVLGEAMSSACVPVASHAAGSTPYLVNDGENGFVYKSENIDSLYRKIKVLIKDDNVRKQMAKRAYLTMHDTWNAKVAGNNLMLLIESLKEGRDTPFDDGPCSLAPIINHTNSLVSR